MGETELIETSEFQVPKFGESRPINILLAKNFEGAEKPPSGKAGEKKKKKRKPKD